MFQSSPSPKTGRYDTAVAAAAPRLKVPILTQSEDWALLGYVAQCATHRRSNPHPVRRLGAIPVPDDD